MSTWLRALGALCCLTLITVALGGSASAAPPAGEQVGWVPGDYPGIIPGTEGRAVFYLTTMFVRRGVEGYYVVHGQWPKQWQDVVNEGLVTVPLTTPWGKPVNPDDGKIDYDFDIVYNYHPTKPTMQDANHNRSPQIDVYHFTKPGYNFARVREKKPELKAALADPARSHQLAVDWVVQQCLTDVSMFLHKTAATWADAVASGFSPLAPSTINSLTGNPYAFDGRANDFLYRGTPEQQMFQFYATDENGKRFWPYVY